MSRQRRDPGPIPKRWLHCPRKSNRLIVDKFMAFKTPLSPDFDAQVPAECRFYPKMFFDSCKAKKIKIGLWIDLTNTSRFYDKAEVEETGCIYVKLQCKGHGETPSKEQTDTFIKLVYNFISNNPLDAIGVHCTHGFNRTGFLIISYLVEILDFSLDVAIQTFAEARPVGIYKLDYLYELYSRFDNPNDTPPAPSLPKWCLEDGDDSDGESQQNGGTASTSDSNFKESRVRNNKNATKLFMEGVSGVYYFNEQPKARNLQLKVQAMCGWKGKAFPGCQPVSMDRNNISLLSQKPYRVSWKADGTRYMMLIDGENEVYFFDRNHTVFKVDNLRFVHRKDLNKHLTNTLLDGEMVIDKVGEDSIPRYLAYDIIGFEGQEVRKLPFYPTRLQCLELEIIKPRYAAMEKMIINKAAEPFSVRKKDFWPISQAGSLLGEKFAKSLSHEPDGLIFQPSTDPYVAGRCDEVLKWKPLSMNSVDFKLEIVTNTGVGIIAGKIGQLYVGTLSRPFGTIKYTKALKDMHGKIIECKYENNQWKFMRERTDKTYPNSYETAKAVCESIQHPVTEEYLIDYIQKHGFSNDTEMMPPPPKKARR